jgi:hypothetical protein
MKFDAPLRILSIATLCALGLVALVVHEGLARASGTEVILRMQAVDPRSLLIGHYVIIDLQETTPADTSCPSGTDGGPPVDGERVRWVALRPNGDHHSVAGMAMSREAALELAPIAVRGHAWCAPGSMRTTIGLNRFYTNQTEAQRIERIMRAQRPGEGRVSAIVSVGRDGNARLKGLIVEGERIELRWI